MLPVLVHSIGAPLGEPIADDFDYLARALLDRRVDFFDGYGSVLYWRPMGRQVYFGLLGAVIVGHPWVVPVLHSILLAAAAWLVYRALRVRWPAPWAAFAASFPMLAESARMLIAWPSHFMDLGAVLFASIALHEASRRRMASALLGVLGSLLCKEVAVLAAFLVPWMPGGEVPRRERLKWTAATAALVIAWAWVYVAVSNRPGMTLPHRLESDVEILATPAWRRLAWAAGNSARAMLSLPGHAGPWDGILIATTAVVLAFAGARIATSAAARARVRSMLPWIVWGAAWFAAATTPLIEIYPSWAPYRAVFAGLGLGIVLAALVGAADARFLAPLLAIRLAAFALSPGPPNEVSHHPRETGSAFDFGRLVRLERLVAITRSVLQARFPKLPPGTRVCLHFLPLQSEYAFGGDRALHVWYRDTTLRWVDFEGFEKDTAMRVATIIEWQPESRPQIALVEPAAMRRLLAATKAIQARDPHSAIELLAAADSLQIDRNAHVFRAILAAKRALCRAALGDDVRARGEAEAALALSSINTDARFALGYLSLRQGDLHEVRRHLEVLEIELPGDARVARLAELCAAAERTGGS